ncbi:SRPBCC domain-containing protein [Actinocorallia sp. A-T 12471]|uniref:SRPBCC domain-containing protein n=1 Tax=Actinocorallia sp. A-T 12471 TaxID=3089813 RepID=UPI0029D27A89|nr:SRPBCC domain-containing protein [Actinocorallia sp. A-T 12471]MDX6744866.1 SRPBCC domain-containing protein [Actinocorallia sp. A-T 12471]
MIDIPAEIAAIGRRVHAGEDGDKLVVALARAYPAAPERIWAALTEPARLARWFLPVRGDLREGGSFATEGNADGTIVRCEPAKRLVLTWGAPESIVTVELTPQGESTGVVLEHAVPAAFVPDAGGALYVGPGWDGALLGLGLYLGGFETDDPSEFQNSPEVLEYNAGSITAWETALRASNLATDAQIDAAVRAATANYTVPPDA